MAVIKKRNRTRRFYDEVQKVKYKKKCGKAKTEKERKLESAIHVFSKTRYNIT